MSHIISYAPSQGQKREARTHSLNFNLVHGGANQDSDQLIHIVRFNGESFSRSAVGLDQLLGGGGISKWWLNMCSFSSLKKWGFFSIFR